MVILLLLFFALIAMIFNDVFFEKESKKELTPKRAYELFVNEKSEFICSSSFNRL